MKRLMRIAVFLVLLAQSFGAMAEMVVFWDNRVIDRARLQAVVWRHETGKISVEFAIEGFVGGYERKFLCNEKHDRELRDATVNVLLKYLEHNARINPYDVLKKANLTGCKKIKK